VAFRAKVASKQLYPKAIVIQIWVCWLYPYVGPERLEAIVSRAKQVLKRKRRCKIGPVLGAAGLSLSLAGGASVATGGPAAEMLTWDTGVSHEIALREEQVSDVSLATFYVFGKENPGTFRPGVRLAVGAGGGCWTGTYYTSPGSRNDAYRPPPRPVRPAHRHALKHARKSP
jgi:hypothetical protein